MSVVADRTCTEVRIEGDDVVLGESKPFSSFRSHPAVVLLGDPGAGKTTEFVKECRALGDAAEYRSARDFIILDLDSHPRWRDAILFIDGLDEIRAGAEDARPPLDSIRNRLDRLGRPAFRISCREADWLGSNDRGRLAVVAPGGKATVVRLDPLDEQSMTAILESRITGDAQSFIEEARRRGVWPLMDNPLNLELLVRAIGKSGTWPESQRETFEMACRALATEQNSEHRCGASRSSIGRVLGAAGYLWAVQLLTGKESLPFRGSSKSLLAALDEVGFPLGITPTMVKQALGTRLFTVEDEGVFRPFHRRVAEFLGGKYLASLVDDGLPPRRVISLMTSPSDGVVVTPLRGLSAWLAVYNREARRLLIDADPVGTGLYGDIGSFSDADKNRLLVSLADSLQRGFIWMEAPVGFREAAWAFRGLASAEMTPAIDEILCGPSSNDRAVEFLCRVLSQADRDMESLASLTPSLFSILWDRKASYWVKRSVLDAYLHLAPSEDDRTRGLKRLLKEIRDGQIADPDDELRGTLLQQLFPGELSPKDIWDHVQPRNQHFHGRFFLFWHGLPQRLSSQEVAETLDALHEKAPLSPSRDDFGTQNTPDRLLVQALESMGDQVDARRLCNWLVTTASLIEWSSTYGEDNRVRAWLEDRPNVQKEIVLEWLEMNDSEDGFPSLWHLHRAVLRHSRLPADFGGWCLGQAIRLFVAKPHLSKVFLLQAHNSLGNPSLNEGLTIKVMREQLRGQEGLVRELDRIRHQRASQQMASGEADEDLRRRKEQHRRKEQRRRQEWTAHLQSEKTALRSNSYAPRNLHMLATTYLGGLPGNGRSWTRDSLEDLTGGDSQVREAVMTALRKALWREDVPEAEDTIEIHSQSQRPWLAYPVLASMQLVAGQPKLQEKVSDHQKRKALAIYYCYPLAREATQPCHDEWFEQNPTLVLDVLRQCAAAGIRNGDESPSGVHELCRLEDPTDLVHRTALVLLNAFPPRTPKRQLREFDRLLKKALRHHSHAELADLAENKLALKTLNVGQRVRWLTVAAMSLCGNHIQNLEDFVFANERRVRHLAELLAHLLGFPVRHADLPGLRNPALLTSLIRVLGASYSPQSLNGTGAVTTEIEAADAIQHFITLLSSIADLDAKTRLHELVGDPQLTRWVDRLTWAKERQQILYREASYSQPSPDQVQRTLANQDPANAADLAALLRDRLNDFSDRVRGDNANLWRQFWNEDHYGRPHKVKREDSCRDVLLADLQRSLPPHVDATPEGHYAANKRSDIRVFSGGFNIPIEIKKSCSPDLWSTLRNQLINQYTTDPKTSGYGILLVLWLGPNQTTRPPNGKPPATTEELREQLRSELTPNEKHKILVTVIDVTKPGEPTPST